MHGGPQEAFDRARRELEKAKRTNAIVSLTIGGIFVGIAVVCFIGALALIVGGLVEDEVAGGTGAAMGVGAFGLFWAATGGLLLFLGQRGLARSNLQKRLREMGVRGTATVLEHTESNLRVDGATMFFLKMRIELPGRPSWELSRNEPVERSSKVFQGAMLPVLVDPADPSQLMIDWWGGT